MIQGSTELVAIVGSPIAQVKSPDNFNRYFAEQHMDSVMIPVDIVPDAVAAYLNAQIEAGAQAVMIFDSWGGVLAHDAYHEFSLAYIRQIVAGLTREKDGERVPCIVFTKGGGLWLADIADSGADAVGLDWTVDIGAARRLVGDRVALQGNLDPSVLFGSPEAVAAEAKKVLDFLLSDQGQAIWANAYLRPVRAAAMPKEVQARFLPASEYARAKTVDYQKMATVQKAFSERYLKDVQ